MSEEKEEEGGIIDFLFKIVFTVILLYVVSYFSGFHQIFGGILGDLVKPILMAGEELLRSAIKIMGLY